MGRSGGKRVHFTDPELQVIQHLAHGATYERIALEMFMSASNISYYAQRLRTRLRVPNNAALVGIALVTGILAPDAWPPDLSGLTSADLPDGDL